MGYFDLVTFLASLPLNCSLYITHHTKITWNIWSTVCKDLFWILTPDGGSILLVEKVKIWKNYFFSNLEPKWLLGKDTCKSRVGQTLKRQKKLLNCKTVWEILLTSKVAEAETGSGRGGEFPCKWKEKAAFRRLWIFLPPPPPPPLYWLPAINERKKYNITKLAEIHRSSVW